jgi:hypothetical protein
MTALKFFKSLSFWLAVICLAAAAYLNGEYVSDKLAVRSERSIGRQVADPEDPQQTINRCLLWALKFGSGWVLFQIIISASKRRQERRTKKIVGRILEADHPLRSGRQWWGNRI